MPDPSLAERLVDHLADGGVSPGSRLPAERALARELGISRPALREATRALTGLNVLEPRTGSGTYLAEIELDDLMAVRLALEPLAASLAAERAQDAERARLRALHTDMAARVDDPVAFARTDLELHAEVARASRNRFVTGSLTGLTMALRLSRARSAGDERRRAATLAELERLVGAIERRRPHDAAEAMRAHLAGVGETLRGGATGPASGAAGSR